MRLVPRREAGEGAQPFPTGPAPPPHPREQLDAPQHALRDGPRAAQVLHRDGLAAVEPPRLDPVHHGAQVEPDVVDGVAAVGREGTPDAVGWLVGKARAKGWSGNSPATAAFRGGSAAVFRLSPRRRAGLGQLLQLLLAAVKEDAGLVAWAKEAGG
jgi:hypothetical protein